MKARYILEICNLKDSYTKKNKTCNTEVYFILNLVIKTKKKKNYEIFKHYLLNTRHGTILCHSFD